MAKILLTSAPKSPSPELLNLAAPHFAVESKTRFHIKARSERFELPTLKFAN